MVSVGCCVYMIVYLTVQVTGAAPIDRSVVEFFMHLDVPIYEMYGMSECTGPHTVSLPSKCDFFTTTTSVSVYLLLDNDM